MSRYLNLLRLYGRQEIGDFQRGGNAVCVPSFHFARSNIIVVETKHRNGAYSWQQNGRGKRRRGFHAASQFHCKHRASNSVNVLTLIERIQQIVPEDFGVQLVPEVLAVGER
nr:hypothetical protein [Paenibacillus taiwanensis]